jgi:divinyl chlorophyllide a 8-vinyl-reductase
MRTEASYLSTAFSNAIAVQEGEMTGQPGPAFEPTPPGARILLAGATGYIGKVLARELVARGFRVVCLLREGAAMRDAELLASETHIVNVCDSAAMSTLNLGDEPVAAAVSCLASRTGGVEDAWAVDHRANSNVMKLARNHGAQSFVLLSAICVQKPKLSFQHAKLAFEQELIQSGLAYSIVRPTAFFKSLAGQVAGIAAGKPFTVFGDGNLTACKPISENDLAHFMADCLTESSRHNAILPVGGPGEALTPRQQGELLFRLCGRTPRFRQVPLSVFDVAIPVLAGLSRLVPPLGDKAEFARIGRYYASESMLLLNPVTGKYDADATPSWGADTLEDFYRHVLAEGMAGQDLGPHKLF